MMETSDYRGPSQANTNSERKQYSQVARATVFPKKEQAIILNASEELQLTDYVVELARIVTPKQITHAFKMSNNRICIYLDSIQLADAITQRYQSIKVKDIEIGLRRMVAPTKRLILSNVSPSIPHDVLENEVRKLGYKQVSPMTSLRAGVLGAEFSHILSSRRQIYVASDEDIQLPSSIVLDYDDLSYRIYLTFDGITCYQCKENGHIAKNCPKTQAEDTTVDTSQQPLENKATSYKRPLSTTTSIASENNSSPDPDITAIQHTTEEGTSAEIAISVSKEPVFLVPEKTAPVKKKLKIATPDELKRSNSSENLSVSEQIKPVQKFIEEANPPFVLNTQQITDFFENTVGSDNPLSIAQEYTNDIPKLLDMLRAIYPHFMHRSIKSRCTRITKKLRKQLAKATESYVQFDDSDSDTSVSSQSSTF